MAVILSQKTHKKTVLINNRQSGKTAANNCIKIDSSFPDEPRVFKKNGVFYIEGIDMNTPSWLQIYNNKPAFLLNSTTREAFAKEVMPFIKSGEIDIDKSLLNEIRYFKHNEPRIYPREIVVPDNIKLMPHQITALDYIAEYNRFAFYLGPGTGKTIIAICAILMHLPQRTLIVTPKAVKEQFSNELHKYLDDTLDNNAGMDVIVTNFEQLEKYKLEAFDMIIVDEAHRAKNYSSIANNALRFMSKSANFIYLFTGTPMDKSRHEILPQLAILDERVMPSKTITMQRYFTINDYYQPDGEILTRSEELTELIKQYSWGKETEDCIDLPEEEDIKVLCAQPPEEYYKLLKNRVLNICGGEVIADSKATLRVKLREICCGHVVIDKAVQKEPGVTSIEHETVSIQNNKIANLRNLLIKLKKGLIFTEFIEDVEIIKYVIEKGTPFKAATIKDRNRAFNPIKEFKDGNIDFLILNSKSGGTGLDLSCTDNVIFYSLPESYVLFYQAKMRIRRHGQNKKCHYYYLLCRDSVEQQLYGALLKKKSFNNAQFKIYN